MAVEVVVDLCNAQVKVREVRGRLSFLSHGPAVVGNIVNVKLMPRHALDEA